MCSYWLCCLVSRLERGNGCVALGTVAQSLDGRGRRARTQECTCTSPAKLEGAKHRRLERWHGRRGCEALFVQIAAAFTAVSKYDESSCQSIQLHKRRFGGKPADWRFVSLCWICTSIRRTPHSLLSWPLLSLSRWRLLLGLTCCTCHAISLSRAVGADHAWSTQRPVSCRMARLALSKRILGEPDCVSLFVSFLHVADPSGMVFSGVFKNTCCGLCGQSIQLATTGGAAMMEFRIDSTCGCCPTYKVYDGSGNLSCTIRPRGCMDALSECFNPCKGGLILACDDASGTRLFDIRRPGKHCHCNLCPCPCDLRCPCDCVCPCSCECDCDCSCSVGCDCTPRCCKKLVGTWLVW